MTQDNENPDNKLSKNPSPSQSEENTRCCCCKAGSKDKDPEKPNHKKFAFFGYEVGGWGALLAFMISIVTLSLTAVDRWLLDANPILRFPEIVNLTCQGWYEDEDEKVICPPTGQVFLEANPLTLINDTSAPHSFTGIRSNVVVDLQDASQISQKLITLGWFYFDNGDPIFPITVAPQTSTSKEIDYYARRSFDASGKLVKDYFLLFKDFGKMISSGSVISIKLKFSFELLNGEIIDDDCVIPIDDEMKENAKTGQFVMYSRECF